MVAKIKKAATVVLIVAGMLLFWQAVWKTHPRRHKDGCGGRAKNLELDSDEMDT